MNAVWMVLLCGSLAAAFWTGSWRDLSAAALLGAQQGVTITFSIAGALCLWTGLSRVMERAGLSEKLGRLLRPILGRLFPNAARDADALGKITGNVTANLLGLGNAATPLGIEAVKRMQALSGGAAATDEMCLLIVLNTASVQLSPATVAAVRASLGAARPFEIVPAVWLASALSAIGGVLAAKVFARHG